ncbi:MAG: hypothetical protein ACKO27_08785 [Ilumatobacteraceae bacterium]
MNITAKRLAVATALIGIGIVSGLGSGTSGAAGTLYEGNVTTCAGIGMGEYLDSGLLESTDGDYSNAYLSWTISGGNTTIDITDAVYNAIIHAIVVKAGNAYYVYSSPEPGMTGPLTGRGVTPRISHWFVCYEMGATTTSSTTTSTTTTTTTTTTVPPSSSTSTTSSTSTSSTVPGPTLPATTTTAVDVQPPFNPDLPDTGGWSGGILSLAALLTGVGAFLRALIRRPA